MKKEIPRTLSPRQRSELAALAALPDAQIRTDLIPERRDWSEASRGAFFRPVKRQITLRLDADILDWFRRRPEETHGYQTRINMALRDHMAARGKGPSLKKREKAAPR